MKNLAYIFLLAAIVSCGGKTKEKVVSPEQHPPIMQQKNYAEGELLIGVKSDDLEMTISQIEEEYGVKLIKVLMEGATNIVHIAVPKGEEQKYIKELQKHASIEYAELNGTMGIN